MHGPRQVACPRDLPWRALGDAEPLAWKCGLAERRLEEVVGARLAEERVVVQPVALHGFGRLARASMPRSTDTCRLLSRHPHAAPLLPHSGKVYLRLLGLRCDTPNHLFEIVGAVGFEPTNPSLVRRNLTVAERRLMSAEEPVSWTDCRWTSACVAGSLLALAPVWLPEISFASLTNSSTRSSTTSCRQRFCSDGPTRSRWGIRGGRGSRRRCAAHGHFRCGLAGPGPVIS